PTWYDWCCENWGTKWNAYCDTVIDDDRISFETAWSTPLPILKKLSETYPDLEIEHWWADEDVGCNVGHAIYKGGKIIEGGFVEDESNDAYRVYIECWNRAECFYIGKDNQLHHKDCDKCRICYAEESDNGSDERGRKEADGTTQGDETHQ
ncbi:MAG: hypothetical protein NC548_41480, partial [Lachnospiraceae bacterium]|nr:hypothetical protein [Lachnospiraceae bacterium]